MIQILVMPITRETRWLYPIDWPELSRWVRFDRAAGRCETCGRPHGAEVIHLGDGRWWDAEQGRWRDGRGKSVWGVPRPEMLETAQPCLAGFGPVRGLPVTRAVLAGCHLRHDPSRNRPRDLAALCQRCHMLHDALEQGSKYQRSRKPT